MLRALSEDQVDERSIEPASQLPSTGERFVPGLGGSIELEHLHRYLFAQQACIGKSVLDIACGEGYGTSILAKQATSVIGVDIAADVVEHARRRYASRNLRFAVGSCAQIPLNDASVDVVVSFETIEHHDQHQEMLNEIRRVLKPGGLLILSSPERFEYSERHGTVNEFHVHELYRSEFVDLVESHFEHVDIYDQKVVFGSAILAEDRSTRSNSMHVDAPSNTSRGLSRPVYLIAAASNSPLSPLDTGVFEQTLAESSEWKWWIATLSERDERIRGLAARLAEIQSQVSWLQAEKGRTADLERTRIAELEGRANDLVLERDDARKQSLKIAELLHDSAMRVRELDKALAEERAALASSSELLMREKAENTDAKVSIRKLCFDVLHWHGPNAVFDNQLVAGNEWIKESESTSLSLVTHIEALDRQLQEFLRAVESDNQSRIAVYERALAGEREARAEIYRSTSWRITSPLRASKDASKAALRAARGMGRGAIRLVQKSYHGLPVSRSLKYRCKDAFFRAFGFALRRTVLYENWSVSQKHQQLAQSQISQFASVDTVLTEPATLAPAYSAASVALWVADGKREWADLPVLRERLAAEKASRLRAVSPRPVHTVTISPKDFERAAAELQFTAHAKPVVTILVPVYNQAHLTLECLTSIAAAQTDVTFEIVVADDASTDETASLLSRVRNIKVHTNRENLNFLRNCNAALEMVAGDYVVFLNNDVQVQDGWLDALLRPFADMRDVGAVGPKIIYPSGHLQEAGVAFNADMTADMIGLNDDPDLPQYNYARRVDFCSGACLMVPTALIRSLEGFSTAFAPAYCEDSDLCLRIQERGLFVYYAPGATVVHHLSGTTAAVDDSEKLRMVATNLVTLADRWQARVDKQVDVRTIAFYLPQFYPFPENDRWWGKGFTEWTNVTKAQPNFVGHYQPHLPADLGYYDLRVAATMEDQANLARRYGLGGFCFYYYWFAGKRLLDLPVERMLETGKPDFPFCLCWANENWTRRWDGQQNHVLMAQSHSDADDEAVILDLIRFFKSPNYIRVDGRPLLIVYRVTLFPDFARTAALWRDVCRREGVGEIYLSMVESFELVNAEFHPSRYGCDATIEFPPQELATQIPPSGELLNPAFSGMTGDYRDLALQYCKRPGPAYTRFRGAMPGWDNTPRRQDHSFCFEHATPGAFQAWLEHVIDETRKQQYGDERIVFINAWNEWAEGAHLEPDRRFGHTYLEALKNATDQTSLLRMQRYTLGG